MCWEVQRPSSKPCGSAWGVSCLSRLIVQDELAKGTLVELSTTVPPLRRTLHLAVHHERQVNAALGLFFGQDPLTRAPATPAPAVLRPHLPCQTLAPTP